MPLRGPPLEQHSLNPLKWATSNTSLFALIGSETGIETGTGTRPKSATRPGSRMWVYATCILVENKSKLTVSQLSDRYDRDRMGLPLTNSRTNKERDPAPHLAANNPRSAQALSSNAASRRGETREVGGKKKVGEASEDWRRGGYRLSIPCCL